MKKNLTKEQKEEIRLKMININNEILLIIAMHEDDMLTKAFLQKARAVKSSLDSLFDEWGKTA